jgi:LmbE family N-acetylglucosaminyl deacetylase
MTEKILIVAAHPDDEVLGCGGTAARLAREGHELYTLILGEGATSRDAVRQPEIRKVEIALLKEQMAAAGCRLGVREVFSRDFPDNRFDSVPLLDLVKAVEEVKERVGPGIVFTHSSGDLNVDHRLVHEAVLTATRPQAGESVRDIYAFEVLSSSEWNFPASFRPDCFFDISSSIDDKLAAMQAYGGELRAWPHPRSLEGIRRNAELWGMKTGRAMAEAFQVVRLIK